MDHICASMFRAVPRIAVSKGENPVFPTASVRAASEGPVGMNKLVMRIGFPVRRFTATGDDDAGAVGRPSPAGLDGCGQMH
jgi:hypothetical protein